MEFKEYVLEQEIFEQWIQAEHDRLVKEGILTGLAGAASNLGTQIARGGGNILGGTARSAYGLGQMGAGALEIIGGGKKKGREKIRRGWQLGQNAGKQIGTGALQIGASPLTAAIRGVQAAGESPFDITGVYSPGGKQNKPWQNIFGLNSGEDEEQPQKQVSKVQAPKAVKAQAKQTQQQDEKALEREKLFHSLVGAYLSPRVSSKAKAQIQATIAKVFPDKYDQVMKKKEVMKIMGKNPSTPEAASSFAPA
jgi:hypothetical protein